MTIIPLDSTPLTGTEKPYFPALTGMRAIAAYIVYFFHFNPFKPTSGHYVTTLLWALFNKFNHLGVSSFFVLSGFLIATRYQNGTDWSARWFRQYLWKRIARIYPLYFLLTCLTFIVFWLRPTYDIYGVWEGYSPFTKILVPLLNLSLLRGFFEKFLYSGILQGWSLTVEECFYIAAPFLILSLRRKSWTLWLWPPLLLGVGGLLVAFFSTHMVHGGIFASYDFMIGSTFFGRSSEFIIGIVLSRLVARQTQSEATASLPQAGLAGGLSLLTIVMVLKVIVPFDNWVAPATSVLAIVVNHVVLPVSIAWIFFGLITGQSLAKRLLSSNPFLLLGRSSYSFYLIHIGVIQIALRNHLTSNILVLFIVLNVMAVFLYTYVEHPLHQWLTAQRIFTKPGGMPPKQTAADIV